MTECGNRICRAKKSRLGTTRRFRGRNQDDDPNIRIVSRSTFAKVCGVTENFLAFLIFWMWCVMVQRAFCVALGLFGALLPAVAQQAHRSISREQSRSKSVLNAPLSLSLYRPKISGATGSSLLLHNGSVPLWLDGTQVGNSIENPGYSLGSQWVQLGFMAPDLLPPALLSAAQPSAQRPSASRVHGSDGKDIGADGKDSPDEMLRSSLNPIYYGGEVGFLYGRWSGKGGGDMWQSYVVGTVGDDKFQITAGVSYDEWNGNGHRAVPIIWRSKMRRVHTICIRKRSTCAPRC